MKKKKKTLAQTPEHRCKYYEMGEVVKSVSNGEIWLPWWLRG